MLSKCDKDSSMIKCCSVNDSNSSVHGTESNSLEMKSPKTSIPKLSGEIQISYCF